MADSVRVDTAALRAAASHADAAASSAAPGSAQVQPCAPDFVSVAASTRFSALVDLTRSYTAMANDQARRLGCCSMPVPRPMTPRKGVGGDVGWTRTDRAGGSCTRSDGGAGRDPGDAGCSVGKAAAAGG